MSTVLDKKSAAATGRGPSGAALRHLGALVRRNLLGIRADPNSMFDILLMPVIYIVLFVYVFGGAVAGSQGEYVQYVMPGLMAMMAVNIAMTAGVGVNSDFRTGVMDRFRTLPISRAAVLSAQVVVELFRMLLSMAVLLVMALLLGLDVKGGASGLLSAVGLTMLFGTALLWVSVLLGLVLKSPQAVQGLGMVAVLPLQFGSSVFAPPDTMPGWLQAFTEVNPLSGLADAGRALINGTPVPGGALVATLVWAVGITVCVAPVAAARFGRADR